MRRTRKIRFEDLVDENKKDLMNDKETLEKIERKVEEKRLKRL